MQTCVSYTFESGWMRILVKEFIHDLVAIYDFELTRTIDEL